MDPRSQFPVSGDAALSAAWLNRVVDELMRAGRFAVAPPLTLTRQGGAVTVHLDVASFLQLLPDDAPDPNLPNGIWVRIEGSATSAGLTSYGWQELMTDAAGNVIDRDQPGTLATDPEAAINVYGDAVPDGAKVLLYPCAETGRLLFRYRAGANFTLTDYKDECVEGIVQRYQRTIIWTDGVPQESDWSYESSQGCCDCGSGTGTGSGSGTNQCGGCTLPNNLTVTIAGFVNGSCTDCANLNGTYTLAHQAGTCNWYNGTATVCGQPAPISLHFDAAGDRWVLTITTGSGTVSMMVAASSFNCSGTSTFAGNGSNQCGGNVTAQVSPAGGGGGGGGTAPMNPCCTSIPQTLKGTVSNIVGPCCMAAGTYPIVYNANSGVWDWHPTGCSNTQGLTCQFGGPYLGVLADAGWTCSPVFFHFTGLSDPDGAGGTYNLTVTQ